MSILETVRHHAMGDAERLCVKTVPRAHPSESRTFRAVYEGAARAAAAMQARGIGSRDHVVLAGTHHVGLYATWLGAVWLGAVPTILAEPSVRIDKQIYWSRLEALLRRIDVKLAVFDPRIETDAFPHDLARATYSELESFQGAAPKFFEAKHDDLLLLQHSSGTTGLQKGVMLSHGAVGLHTISYSAALNSAASTAKDDVVVSWLPLYHDMGLIACFIQPLFEGKPVIWLSPFEWVSAPAMLLEAITAHRGTHVWLPNFAFSLIGGRALPKDAKYDLSSVKAVINCSEPVTADAMSAFADRLAPHGLSPSALHTCYAMAENVFAVSASTPNEPPRQNRIDERVWRTEHRAVSVPEGAGGLVHVSCGPAVQDCAVRIVDEASKELPSGHAGRILIRSRFLFSGYHGHEEGQAARFEDGFYDTGDIGYVDSHDHVYVTGRKKDLVIVGGKNVYPADIEQVAMEVPGVHPGRSVCFGVPLRGMGTEGLVLLAESAAPEETWPEIVSQIRTAVPARLDLDLTDVRVLPLGQLRKSTSGKLARGGNREWYLEERFGAVPRWVSATAVVRES